jgi:TrmH family RNA methyltransferase
VIENPRSPRVRAVAKLAKKSRRQEAGLFLVEGPQAVGELLSYWPDRVVDVFITDRAKSKHPELARAAAAAGVDLEPVTEDVLSQMADTQTPQGVIAVAHTSQVTLAEALHGTPGIVVLLDEVRDPGNVGAIIRVADAVGADAVVFVGDCVDPYNPKVVRATTGSMFHIPLVQEENMADTVSAITALGAQVFAADMAGDSLPTISPEQLAKPTAWIFGNEAHGVSEEALLLADRRVAVPQYGDVESLNLATAAAVCLYQSAFAQRNDGPQAHT